MLRSIPQIEVRSIREMNTYCRLDRTSGLTLKEQEEVWPQIEQNLKGMKNWPILPADFNVANISYLTRSHLSSLQRYVER